MKKVFSFSLFAVALFLGVPGCGGSSEPSSMVEGVEISDLEAYEADMARQEAEMNSSMANQ